MTCTYRIPSLRLLALVLGSLCSFAPSRAVEGLPVFTYDRVVLDPTALTYNPTGEVIFPSVIKASDYFANPLGEYYLYYAPHDNPGGICLAYADSPEGPWTEYAANPVIPNQWSPYFSVAHTSSPHAFWSTDAQKLYLYFHGENDVTRVASSSDGITFIYERACLTRADFDNVSEVSYARVFEHTMPSLGNKYTMLLMCNYGSNPGTRAIYLAWSDDCLNWTTRRTPLIWPNASEGGQLSGPHLFPWNGRYYVVYHGSSGDMHVTEVGEDFNLETHLGVFHDSLIEAPDNKRSAAPSFLTVGDTMYMFYEAGQRGGTKIALAKSAVTGPPPPSGLTATAVNSVEVALAWTDHAGNELDFEIERAVAPDGTFTAAGTVGANAAAFTDRGLSGAVTYLYRIRAYNGAGVSAYSNIATITTPPGGATVVLYSVAAHDGFVVESAVDSATGSAGSGGSLRLGDDHDRQLKSVLSFDTSVIPDGATVVAATLRIRKSGGSGGIPFDTLGACWIDLKGGAGFGGAVGLAGSDFQAAADATAVAQLSRPALATDNFATAPLDATGRALVDSTGYTQLRLYFSPKHDNDGGNDYLAWYAGEAAAESDRPRLEISYLTEATSPPAAPTDLSATAVSSSQLDLAWSAATDASSYTVLRASVSGGPYEIVATGIPTTSYDDTALPADTTFYYVVTAANAGGESPPSNEATATTQAPPPDQVIVLPGVAPHDGWVTESAVGSGIGGSSSGSSLRAGDAADRQLMAIVSFDTSAIPADVTIVSATLRLKKSGSSGGNPFDTLGVCHVDIKGGAGFGDSLSLGASDFQAAAEASEVAILDRPTTTNGNLSRGALSPAGLACINRTGHTQLRVYFTTRQDGDGGNDFISWHTAEATTEEYRPSLEIVYQ